MSSRVFRIIPHVAVIALGASRPGAAQRVDPQASPPQLGLGASSAFAVYGGTSVLRYASLGPEVGATLDLGWIGSRRVRLSVGLDYLATSIDRTDSLGVRETGRGYVFSALTSVNVQASPARRVAPYAGLGVGVDAVGTTIQNQQIGSIYNTNVFEVHALVGARLRVAPRGRLVVEARGTEARVVRRIGLRVGYAWLYNEFAR